MIICSISHNCVGIVSLFSLIVRRYIELVPCSTRFCLTGGSDLSIHPCDPTRNVWSNFFQSVKHSSRSTTTWIGFSSIDFIRVLCSLSLLLNSLGLVRIINITQLSCEIEFPAFLWIMWLATAGTTASINFTGGHCDKLFLARALTICGEVNAIEAFSFLSWLTRMWFRKCLINDCLIPPIVMGYFIALLGFSIRAAHLGNTRIWTTSVDKRDFESGSGNSQDKKTVTEQPPV